ncbi:MAG: low temperature requirement protein A [Bacteroidales bacterium]|nr:low temperature requirement protein A [Bacteroidales bacterium]MCF8454297.1 low temperature requirement protein A [Bacteroidales bacterium]
MSIFKDAMHVWWAKPTIRTDENEELERKTTWLELFYDLSFVGILAQLSHLLYQAPSWENAGIFAFLFVPAWWIWNSSTYYNERYERNDIRHRVFTFLGMIPMAGIAYAIHSGLEKGANIFAISYIVSRILIIYLWFSAASSPTEKKLSRQFFIGFSISVILWSISLFVSGSFKYMLWGAAMVIDLVTPIFTLKTQLLLPKISVHHIPERFGLLTILTIGETVIGAINGFSANKEINIWVGVACALGLVVSFLIWWLYHDHVLYRLFKKNIWAILGWSYLHLPLAMGITAVGAGILALVTGSYHDEIVDSIRWLICGSLAFTIFIISLFAFVSENEGHQEKVIEFHKKHTTYLFGFKVVSIVLILLVGFFGKGLNAATLLALLVFILFIPAINGVYIWLNSHLIQQKISNTNENI